MICIVCVVGVGTPGDLNIHYGCAWDCFVLCSCGYALCKYTDATPPCKCEIKFSLHDLILVSIHSEVIESYPGQIGGPFSFDS